MIVGGITHMKTKTMKKNRHSKEGYMTDQEWKEYFEDKPPVCDNSIDCTEEEFKQIHKRKIR